MQAPYTVAIQAKKKKRKAGENSRATEAEKKQKKQRNKETTQEGNIERASVGAKKKECYL